MVPMAARLGVDHQRLQQFITSSTWDYAAVRRNVACHFAARQQVEALVVDQALHELQIVLAVILGTCPLCGQPSTLDRLAAALAGT